tara:strand:+ start:16586 stop:17389 length:804 start_codon:yes stop_codon:yes gene_type:complete
MNTYKKLTFCNNCGKSGHLFHQCRIPITSIGIITFRKIKNNIELLMIKRKDTLSFVDFMRGKYNLEDIDYIKNLFEKMSLSEHKLIRENDFFTLWKYVWGHEIVSQYKNEEKVSLYKFNSIKDGYTFNNNLINLDYILSNISIKYNSTEWGFPKGRRNYQEKDISCGLREFEEETGYSKDDLTVISNIFPIEEIFTGSNLKSYKHKYFLALMDNNIEPENEFQTNEINEIKWIKLQDINKYIRDYNIEKIKLLDELINILKTYKLYI